MIVKRMKDLIESEKKYAKILKEKRDIEWKSE